MRSANSARERSYADNGRRRGARVPHPPARALFRRASPPSGRPSPGKSRRSTSSSKSWNARSSPGGARCEAATRPELPAEPGNRDYSAPRAAQVELLKSKEAALEKNVERLYCAAKRRVAKQDEELHELSTHERARAER